MLGEFAASIAVPTGDLPLLADLLSLAGTGSVPNPELTPQRKKERTFDLLIRGLETIARQQPIRSARFFMRMAAASCWARSTAMTES